MKRHITVTLMVTRISVDMSNGYDEKALHLDRTQVLTNEGNQRRVG
jgi:hypothetical protein